MPAPKGNRFWEARSSHGRDKLFKSADTLWTACVEYFEWAADNPLEEEKLFCHQGEITTGIAAKMRAMTIDGLCLFLDINSLTWRRWREDEDFCTIVDRAEKVIRDQKFSGASAGLLNANIIARDLGLKEATTNEHTGPNGGPIQAVSAEMTPEQAAEAYKQQLG